MASEARLMTGRTRWSFRREREPLRGAHLPIDTVRLQPRRRSGRPHRIGCRGRMPARGPSLSRQRRKAARASWTPTGRTGRRPGLGDAGANRLVEAPSGARPRKCVAGVLPAGAVRLSFRPVAWSGPCAATGRRRCSATEHRPGNVPGNKHLGHRKMQRRSIG